MIKQPSVYILASERNGTLYIGVTSDLKSMNSAIEREKSLKEWKRAWKLRLVESVNPDWL